MKKLWLLVVMCLALASCTQQSWEKTQNGAVIRLKAASKSEASTVKVSVVNDNIIRVTAVPGKSFSKAGSLVVIDQETTPQFTVLKEEGSIIVATSGVNARVSLATGQVTFTGEDGSLLLQEREGGRRFTPFEAEGTQGYTMQQVWESPANEAFFGLGQHQSDEFNYKGRNEELFQYNTKVSLPVVVSDRNYAILWDNYSLSRFGDPREYANLDLFKLYNAKGEEGGLTATYLTNSDPGNIFVERTEAAIDYENLETVKNFPEGFRFNNSTIVWEGEMEPAESGLFHFKLYYAGYTKVWLDGEPVVSERWRTAWNPNSYKFKKEMEAGRRYPVKVEWRPDGGISYLGLKVLSPRPAEEQNALSFWSEMGDQIDYYFIRGNNSDEVISGYRTLTGKAQIMPKWAMGYWQSRERYKTGDELLEAVNEYRQRGIPLDNIVLDWFYWPEDSWGSHQFDAARFPDPTAMVDSVHRLNARIMISVWPKFYYTTDHYKAFDGKGWMYRRATRDSIRDWVGRGYIGSFYDAYNPEARKLFWNQMKENLYPKGFDAWWMDASEPDILSNASINYRKSLMTPTALGPSAKYFNAYALVNAEAIYNGQREADPDRRVFLLTRSGFPGLQRYSTATWSGDIGTRWEDMKAQISAGLNFAISGIPYWTMDIGGFCVENRYTRAREGSEDLEEWRELNTRWHQFGAFCPLYRSHGQFPFREIYNIAPENHPAYKTMVWYNKFRYRLMPYVYTLAGMTWHNDYTIMRPLVMDFNGDITVNNIGDQYMFGPSLMVAPVYEYKARTREVYFPAATGWYDLYSGQFLTGGEYRTVDAPYEKMPLYVREGAILPFGPEITSTAEKAADPVTLYVYTGRDGAFTLYEDEGVNYDYEKGEFSTIPITWDDAAGKLTIGARQGSWNGMPETRTFNVMWISKEQPQAFDLSAVPRASVTYDGTAVSLLRNP
ncbi:MAG: TIM-barrel domain-containing protein [Prolixibacteraceae bacterium]|mgnify:FL=1|jgi:alpha-D-xyloside xylohydrolase|nr:glycoside hydrolase family 31 protein [Bacteroidota bacterium]HOF55816.1 glycoside hydrolase family 31 protein [Prolixibacteraceae bacterium]HOS00289.1 glycoside hydrolase family 31 protein [Prolixibacteraceae bacterium]HOS89309.1 glycoside hydrolase family 31 protein [Prolixibacteraceae bacterium]HPL45640.1 glycoside hydrolase family 31 protein [Prolixibacteraceae bacterium]